MGTKKGRKKYAYFNPKGIIYLKCKTHKSYLLMIVTEYSHIV